MAAAGALVAVRAKAKTEAVVARRRRIVARFINFPKLCANNRAGWEEGKK
jgi:hypothetical protein